jgi:hypothetical protein
MHRHAFSLYKSIYQAASHNLVILLPLTILKIDFLLTRLRYLTVTPLVPILIDLPIWHVNTA